MIYEQREQSVFFPAIFAFTARSFYASESRIYCQGHYYLHLVRVTDDARRSDSDTRCFKSHRQWYYLQSSYKFWKTWKVLEFYSGIFQDWKVLEKSQWSWKVLEICLTQLNARSVCFRFPLWSVEKTKLSCKKNMKCMEGSKENYQWDLGSVGVNVNFRALEKSWKSPGNLFLKKGTNPVSSRKEKLQDGNPIQVTSHLHQHNSNSEKRTLTTSRQGFFNLFSYTLIWLMVKMFQC